MKVTLYHTATFTESKILEALGAGDEIITRIRGAASSTENIETLEKPCKFVSRFQTHTITRADIFWDKPTKAQKIFDEVHKILPNGFSIKDLSLRRKTMAISYGLPIEVDKVFRFKTFSFKPGVFKRYNAETIPAESLQQVFKDFKQKLKNKIPLPVYRKVKDSILMNYNPYSINELKKLFFDVPYVFLLEERDGHFTMSDFTGVI